ncbi:hypothetical protein OROMI_023113 [Orobanche minor]
MDYQQPHGYMRPPPPPPPLADPYQRPPLSVPPPPPNHPWPYSTAQFQYQSQTQHSPSPPPPQWPPIHSSEHPPPHPPPHYPTHQPPPYSAHHPHYPPLLPPRPLHVPQSYSQDLGNGSWSHHQLWQCPSNDNEEDWGAKAKAWAAAKAATENQHPSSQFVSAGRPEEHNHFRDQYSQSNDPQFLDVHTQSAPASNYQQYPGAVGPTYRTGLSQLQDSQYTSFGQSSYAADIHVPFATRDGSLAGDSIAPSNPFVHQQECNVEAEDRYEKFSSSSSLPVAPLSQHRVQPLPPAGGRSGWIEEPHNFGSMPAVSAPDPSDQPLNFAPHYNRNMDQHAQPNYTHKPPVRGGDPTVALSSNYAWTPSMAQGAVYPPVPQSIPSGPQVDYSIAMPAPASGHSATMFPTGPSFQPAVPMMGAAFGVGTGVHPIAFPGDAYGGVSERPKKASVPNWLREEIIKNKAVLTSSAPEISRDDSQSIEDGIDKSSGKGYEVDSKSNDSSRSSEDEDEVEAARTAAINQEIKRVLTEVLLKVTDELFDEIATKVLKEEDLSVEVGRDVDFTNHSILPSTHSVLTPKTSAKILTPIKTRESDGIPGDVLGLASYASDEEDEEIQSSSKLNPNERSTHQQSSSSKLLEGNPDNENGGSTEAAGQQITFSAKLDTDGIRRKSPANITPDNGVRNTELSDHKAAGDLASIDELCSSKKLSKITEYELQDGSNISKLNISLGTKVVERNDDRNSDARKLKNDDNRIQDSENIYDKDDRLESKRSSAKDHKDSESSKGRLDKKGYEMHGRHSRIDRTDYHDYSKDKGKEKGRADEEVMNTESRKWLSPSGSKEGTDETQRDKRALGKKYNNEKRQDRTGDKKREQSRHKSESESGRHKRHRSSSVGVRGRESKDNSVVSRANDSNDEASDDARRKSHHPRRRKSPSPIRTRKRYKCRGLLIASTLSAGILPTLLLRLPEEKDQDQGQDHLYTGEDSRGTNGTVGSRNIYSRPIINTRNSNLAALILMAEMWR